MREVHGCSMNGVCGRKIEEDLCEKWEREKGMGGFREEIMGVRT